MTKALFLPVMALISMLSFSGTSSIKAVSKEDTKTVSPAKPVCGPWITFYNHTSYNITRITLQFPSGSVHINNPTFPYLYHGANGGNCTLFVYTDQSGQSGTVTAYHSVDNSFIGCEAFTTPYQNPLVFFADCTDYYVIINDAALCP